MGVLTSRDGPVAIVTMSWPEQRNALGPEEATEVSNALREAAAPREVAGVVLTGEGAFCAGGNLKGAASRSGMPPEERRTLVYGSYQGLIGTLLELPVPTVAAVDGPAVGMGLDIALACDSRFIGPEGWISQGWGRMSLVPATGGVLFLQLRTPDVIWQILEHNARMDGDAAAELNLAETTGGETARQRAVERVRNLSSMSRAALEAYAHLARYHLRVHVSEHLTTALQHQIELLADPEFRDRVAKVLR